MYTIVYSMSCLPLTPFFDSDIVVRPVPLQPEEEKKRRKEKNKKKRKGKQTNKKKHAEADSPPCDGTELFGTLPPSARRTESVNWQKLPFNLKKFAAKKALHVHTFTVPSTDADNNTGSLG